MYFNASPPKLLDVATSRFVVRRSQVEKDTGQKLI